jgi:hypothetical protein
LSAPGPRVRPPSSRVVYVGLGLLVLLGVVAFASRGHAPPTGSTAGHARAPVQYFFDVVFTLAIVATLSVILMLAFVRASAGPKTRGMDFRAILLIIGFVTAISFVGVRLADRFGENGTKAPRAAAVSKATKDARRKLERATADPKFHWPVALGTLAFLGAGLAVLIARERRRREKGLKERMLAERLAEVLDDTLDDLRAEPDPRRAIIAAYARMERVLAAHGIPRRESDAPLEYLARILDELEASKHAIRGLTELFEVAKFSDHPIDPVMKERAIRALESLRDDLRRPESEREAPPVKDVPADLGGVR